MVDTTRHSHARARERQMRTEVNQRKFLAAYVATGNVSAAAKLSGIGRATVYKWLDRDPAYAEAFDDAKAEAIDALEFEARRRAVDGVEKPIFHAGHQVAAIRKYSDSLLMFLLKAAKPEKFAHRYVHAAVPLEEIVAGSVGATVISRRGRRRDSTTPENLVFLAYASRRAAAGERRRGGCALRR